VVRIPLKRRTRGGRRLMVASDVSIQPSGIHSSAHMPRNTVPDDPILKALGRTWRWKRLIEAGMSIAELAAAERVDKSHLCRLLRLTLLAPAIIEAILDSTLPKEVLLADIIGSSENNWAEQKRRFARR
jgi:hypothetical protein